MWQSLVALFMSVSSAAQVHTTVVVIDTGSDFSSEVVWCPSGHRDFTNTSMHDGFGHGNNIASLIAQNAKGPYCIIAVKYLDSNENDMGRFSNWLKSLEYAISLKPNIINMSVSGTMFDEREKQLIVKALNMGIKVVAAAGNRQVQLTKNDCVSFPACVDPRVIVVGCSNCESSNYGPMVTAWEKGKEVTGGGYTLTGTSQATAVHTGKLIN